MSNLLFRNLDAKFSFRKKKYAVKPLLSGHPWERAN